MVAAMIGRFIAAALTLLAFAAPAAAQDRGERARTVVELYTSQGCNQCPRANRLLGMFSREEGVLALTFPVGIWDYLGWRDTFARPEFSERQIAYSRSLHVRGRFTPQLIIDGAAQISASDWDEARATFDHQHATPDPAHAPDLSLERLRNNRVRATVGSGPAGSNADIWMIAYDPGPVVVVVAGGVNLNRSVPHYNLVRWMERLDSWDGRSAWFERSRCFPECAVIVQAPNGGPILSAAYTYRARRY